MPCPKECQLNEHELQEIKTLLSFLRDAKTTRNIIQSWYSTLKNLFKELATLVIFISAAVYFISWDKLLSFLAHVTK